MITKEQFTKVGYDPYGYEHRMLLLEKVKKYEPFETLCDIGFGDGTDLYLYEDAFPSVKLTGVDRLSDYSKFRASDNVEKVCADIYAWIKDVPDNMFDIVTSNGVLMYLGRSQLEECIRIARKAVITTENEGRIQDIKDYVVQRGHNATVTEITASIRPTWADGGYICEIIK